MLVSRCCDEVESLYGNATATIFAFAKRQDILCSVPTNSAEGLAAPLQHAVHISAARCRLLEADSLVRLWPIMQEQVVRSIM